jgi:protease-4
MTENKSDPFESALEPAGAGREARRGSPREWEREVLEKIALAALTEQRRARRWGIFFKLLLFVFLFALLYLSFPSSVPIGPHTAMVRIEGVVADGKPASAENIIEALDAAFAAKGTRGVLLRADSPGGSPVQAAYVYDEIRRLKKQYPDIPVYAVVTDLCASACYYMISAADKIYANRGSLVGSIGVLYEGFGFTGLLDKLGVQRRLITAGKNKGMLDPFSPLKPDDVAHLKVMLAQVHQQFIDAVKKGRGKRLANDQDLFTGMIWTGQKAMTLGLVDGLASPGAVARDVIGAEKITDYTPQPNWLRQLADSLGASIGRNVLPAQGPGPHLR